MADQGLRSRMSKSGYERYQKALKFPKKQIDNAAPPLATGLYYNVATLGNQQHRLCQIEAENRFLLKIINQIYRTKGKVDTSAPQVRRRSNYCERLFKNKAIEKENVKLFHLFSTTTATLTKAVLDKDYEQQLLKMVFQARYPEYYSSYVPELEQWDICPTEEVDRLCCDVRQRVECYMDVAIDDQRTSPDKLIKLGRLYMEIYRDYAPVAADNFLSFVRGDEGSTYKGTQFFRIQKGLGCVGGDVESNDGGGYRGIGGNCFPNENHLLQFNGPGVISTFTLFPGHNHSHFFLSFRPLESMNGKFVVFGRLIKSLIALERIEECGTMSGAPKQKVVVSKCGVVERLHKKTPSKRDLDPQKSNIAQEVVTEPVEQPEGPPVAEELTQSQNSKTGGTDVEQAVTNLPQPSGPLALGNSGYLSQECSQERQAMYSQLVHSYKWTDKIHEYSTLAAQLLGQNQLKRSYIVTGSNKRRRTQTSSHNVPIQNVDQVIATIDRQYADMSITISRPFITNAILQITLGKVLQAVVAFKGLLIEWVVVKGVGETLDLWSDSRHKVFRKITETSHAAMLHFSSPTMPELAVRSFMTWLHSYITLFSEPCKRCGNHLNSALPPTWRDFRTLEAHHEECKV